MPSLEGYQALTRLYKKTFDHGSHVVNVAWTYYPGCSVKAQDYALPSKLQCSGVGGRSCECGMDPLCWCWCTSRGICRISFKYSLPLLVLAVVPRLWDESCPGMRLHSLGKLA